MGKFFKWFGIAVFGFIVLVIVVVAMAPTPNGAGSSGGDAATAMAEPEVAVDAIDLARAYKRNEVAANAEYSGKRLAVTGIIESISLDFADNPVVAFQGAEMYQNPQASFDKDDSAAISALEKGQKITVHCATIGEVIGTPMLDDCTL